MSRFAAGFALLVVAFVAGALATFFHRRSDRYVLHENQRGWVEVRQNVRLRWSVRILCSVAVLAFIAAIEVLG